MPISGGLILSAPTLSIEFAGCNDGFEFTNYRDCLFLLAATVPPSVVSRNRAVGVFALAAGNARAVVAVRVFAYPLRPVSITGGVHVHRSVAVAQIWIGFNSAGDEIFDGLDCRKHLHAAR